MKTKTTALTGLNLALAATLSTGAAAAANNQATSPDAESNAARASAVLHADTREFEASFLRVSASCKVSHAAFEAVRVGLENVSSETVRIHAEIEQA